MLTLTIVSIMADTRKIPISHFKIALTNVRVFDGNRICEPGTVFIDGELIGGPDTASTYEVDGRGLRSDYLRTLSVILLVSCTLNIHLWLARNERSQLHEVCSAFTSQYRKLVAYRYSQS